MKKRTCLLSVAMIVRDEEHNIRRALESIKDIADEIVVVDTGSKDKTPEIVREYTDKLYFHEWRNDFSEARNYSLKFPTCEWVLILDADEEASEEFKKNIREFLKNLPDKVNTVYVPTLSYLDWNYERQEVASTPRIFRNGTVYYKNIVHNQPVYKPEVVHFRHEILHYGYIWTRKLKKKKYERTRNLIVEFLKDCKDPINRLYYLVQLYKTETTAGKPWARYKIGWQILEEYQRSKKLTPIMFEFLYLFGIESVLHGYYDLAEMLLKEAIRKVPFYPDPYFGMMAMGERKKDWDLVIKYGEKFLEVLDKAVKNVEKITWTIMTMKEIGTAHALLAMAYFEKREPDKFGKHVEIALENFNKNVNVLLVQIFEKIKDIDADFLRDIYPHLEKILSFCRSKRILLPVRNLLVKLLESGEQPEEILQYVIPANKMDSLLLRRIREKKDLILLFFVENGSYIDFVKNNGVGALLFLFDIFLGAGKIREIMRILNDLRKMEDARISGISWALLGDIFLKLGNLRQAIDSYKEAVKILPETSNFIKPVIEDLKTFLDTDIEGVYEEILKYFTKRKDIIYEFALKFNRQDLALLHLISDHPFAIYLSAKFTDDNEKRRNLLLKIKDKSDRFPFYYYHLAKTYEKEDPNNAFKLHLKACEENEFVGDLKTGKHLYDGFYPIKLDITKRINNSETIWAGNISEKIPTLRCISPVRAWKKWKGKFLAFPYPSDEAIKIFYERASTNFKKLPFSIEKEPVFSMLKYVEWKDVKVYDITGKYEENIQPVLRDFGIRKDDSSKNILILSGIEQFLKLSEILNDRKEAVFFYWVPDLEDRENLVWFFPPFRVLRTTFSIKEELSNLGFELLRMETFGPNLRGVYVKKK